MRRVFGLLFNRWVWTVIGLVAAAVVIWWVGPTIAIKNFYPFESEWVRWSQIAVLFLAPISRWTWRFVKARRASKALQNGLLRPSSAPLEARRDVSAGEVAQLGQRFEQALDLLQKRRFGGETPSLWARIRALGSRQYLYDLPWYVFIGAPGAGKTTALVNSGLRFPLATKLGRDAVRGVGGTRDCDWWFTDEAVFLDTAGRYTTQQSNQEVDAGAWKGFLQLLKKSRPRRPINGVLVTVSVADLLQQSPMERDAHTQAIRARVRELYDELGVRFPIYVLVSKTDLLAGFTEFFGGLGRDERAQVWGFTLSYGDHAVDPAMMSGELERLEQRLYEQLPDRLDEERDPARRVLLYSFPHQFALLRGRLVDFVETTFAPTTFEAAALLRGVYFTSGTQEGSPIDRVMGTLGRDFGLERRLLPAQHPSGRSYFLTRLLREVVFPEAGLAGLNLREERRRQWLHAGAIAAAAGLLIVASAAWWVSYAYNRTYLAEVAVQAEDVRKALPPPNSELPQLLPALTAVGTLSETSATPEGSVPLSHRFGLHQGGKIEAASRAGYRRMLQGAFMPSLTAYLTRQLRQSAATNQDESYDTLKTYVMLHDAKHFNRDAVWRWFEARSADLLPGARPEMQKALKGHFERLYESGWVDPGVGRDDALLAQARAAIGREPLPKRIYDRLKRGQANLGEFTITEKVGPKAALVFERQSREPLTKGIPGLYTKDGYYKHFAIGLKAAAVQLAEEAAWVLGTGDSAVAVAAESPALIEGVKRLYLEDYRRLWRRFVDDIAIVKGSDLTRNIEITRALSGPDTPLKPFVKAIERETSLSVAPEGDPGLIGSITGKAQQYAGKAGQIMTGSAVDLTVKTMVDDQFEDIRRLAGTGGGPAPIDAMIQQLNEFYQYLVAAKVALDEKQPPPSKDSANKLRAEVARLPEPIRPMLQSLVESSSREIDVRVKAKEAVDKQIEADRKAAEKRAEEERRREEKRAEEDRRREEKRAEEDRRREEKETGERQRAQKEGDDRRQFVAKTDTEKRQKIEDEKRARELALEKARQLREQIDLELRAAEVGGYCAKAINGRYPFIRSSKDDVTAEDFSRLFAPKGVLDSFYQKYLVAHLDTTSMPWRFRDPAMGTSSALYQFQRAQVIRDIFFKAGGTTPSIQLTFRPVEMDASIQRIIVDVDGQRVVYEHGPQRPTNVQFPAPNGRGQVRISITPPAASGVSGKNFDGFWALFRMFDEYKVQQAKQLEKFTAPIVIEGRRAVFEVKASSVLNPFDLPELTEFRCPVGL